jgi:hypothetical protein
VERKQASNVIKEIFALCHYIDGKSIRLLPPDENNPISKGFMVQIETVSHELEQCIKPIAHHNNLSLHREGSLLVIH